MSIRRRIHALANRVVKHTRWYDTYWEGVGKFWRLRRFDLHTVALGSNSALSAYDFSSLDGKGMNWALKSQSLLYDFSILKNYYSFLADGATVLITLCPFSSLNAANTPERNQKYYTFLHPATIYDFDEERRVRALQLQDDPFGQNPWKCISNTAREMLRKVMKKRVPAPDFEASANKYLNGWKKQFGISDLEAPLTETNMAGRQIRRQTLSDMIRYCKDRGLRPWLVIPPIHPMLSQRLTPKFRETYIYSFVREVLEQADATDVSLLDYIDAPDFRDDKSFTNAFLLSESAAKAFTDKLLAQVSSPARAN